MDINIWPWNFVYRVDPNVKNVDNLDATELNSIIRVAFSKTQYVQKNGMGIIDILSSGADWNDLLKAQYGCIVSAAFYMRIGVGFGKWAIENLYEDVRSAPSYYIEVPYHVKLILKRCEENGYLSGIGSILDKTHKEFLKVKTIGPVCGNNVVEALRRMGYQLKE